MSNFEAHKSVESTVYLTALHHHTTAWLTMHLCVHPESCQDHLLVNFCELLLCFWANTRPCHIRFELRLWRNSQAWHDRGLGNFGCQHHLSRPNPIQEKILLPCFILRQFPCKASFFNRFLSYHSRQMLAYRKVVAVAKRILSSDLDMSYVSLVLIDTCTCRIQPMATVICSRFWIQGTLERRLGFFSSHDPIYSSVRPQWTEKNQMLLHL